MPQRFDNFICITYPKLLPLLAIEAGGYHLTDTFCLFVRNGACRTYLVHYIERIELIVLLVTPLGLSQQRKMWKCIATIICIVICIQQVTIGN